MINLLLKNNQIFYDFNKLPILKDRCNLKKKLYDTHLKSDFLYCFNDYGYRASFDYESLLDSKKIVCIGCSFTEGVGLPEDETWPYILSKNLNSKYINLGLAGGSDGYVIWQIMNVINNLQNQDIYVLIPPIGRSFFLNDALFGNLNSYDLTVGSNNQTFYKFFDYQRFILMSVCKQYNIKYITWDSFGKNFTKARDNQHFGVDYQSKIVEEFLKL